MGPELHVQPNLVTTTYRITGLHYIYGCPTLSSAHVGWLYINGLHLTYGYPALSAAHVC